VGSAGAGARPERLGRGFEQLKFVDAVVRDARVAESRTPASFHPPTPPPPHGQNRHTESPAESSSPHQRRGWGFRGGQGSWGGKPSPELTVTLWLHHPSY
jgi:hypothetical protein